MASNQDSIDLDFTFDGDFIINGQGDIKDTSEDLLLSFRNEIASIVKSNLEDWREDPSIGANLEDFVGEPNTKDIADAVKSRIASALSLIIRESDVSIKAVPVNVHKLLVIITIEVLATPENRLVAGESIVVNFLYDYFERGIFVPLDDLTRFGGRRL